MRCPDCNRFVSYDEPEAEIDSYNFSEKQLTAEVRIVLKCAECGEELKEATKTFEKEIICPECGSSNLECDNIDSNGDSRFEEKDDKGKPIKNSRYWKTFYIADLVIEMSCLDCKHEWMENEAVEEQASFFEELV